MVLIVSKVKHGFICDRINFTDFYTSRVSWSRTSGRVRVGSLTRSGAWRGQGLYLGDGRSFSVHQEVVEELHFLLHLLDLISVFVQDVLPHKLRTLRSRKMNE